jgi:undecaprenyl-diphosphatase
MWQKYKSKIWLVIIFVALLIFLSDQISVHLFKDVFHRLRPCHNPDLEGMVHIVNGHCGGKYGFYSSHASSIFAVAVFTLSMLGSKNLWLSISVLLMAILVSYSRIYLGVHYPGDVIAGAIIGSMLAWMIARFLKNIIRKPAIAV